jgi:LuxR family transcriptional regulator, maltose regulon positive regulatory protein
MAATRAHVSRLKTLVPVLPASAITRERLRAVLDGSVETPDRPSLMMLSAPAGFGKTTLLASWAPTVASRGRALAWCSLDDTDSSTYRFWSSVLTALSSSSPVVRVSLQGLSAPHGAGDADFLAGLVESLEGTDAVLVLENLHEVSDPGVLHDLDHVLAALPDGVTAVLSSRSDPPLVAIQAARLRGNLRQLRANDLAFQPDEVALSCQGLSEEQVESVWTRTEGWPAMVKLMEQAVRSGAGMEPDAAHDVELADYLFHENFRSRSDEVQHLLLCACVPRVVTIDLAAQLSGLAHAGSLLDEVSQVSGLVSRTVAPAADEAVYRFHPMLRAYLHGEFLRRDREAEREAQRQTALWCMDHGLDLAAVGHAVATGDRDFENEVMRSVGPGLINRGEASLLLDALAAGRARAHGAWTTVIRSAALLDQGSLLEASAALMTLGEPEAAAEDPGDPFGGPVLRAASEATHVHLERREGLPVDVDRLTVPLETVDLDLRILVAAQRGSALAWQGDLEGAEAELAVGVELARVQGSTAALIDCLASQAAVHCARSDFRAVVTCVEEALELASTNGWDSSGRTAYPHVLEGWGTYQALDDEMAIAHVARAVELVEPTADPTVRISVEALEAVLAFGVPATQTEAADNLHGAWLRYPGVSAAPCLVAYAAVADARMSILTRRLQRVPEIRDLVSARLGECGELGLIEAMEREATGHRRQARALLRTLATESSEFVVPLSRVEALALAASLACQDDDEFAAVELARQALAEAEALQGLRPLVDAGDHFHALLRRGRGRWGAHESLVARVLEHTSSPSLPSAALTSRELEVLRELPNLSTVEDIAAAMYVSVNTVKTHLRSIYRKMGVASRRAAVGEARRVGLL